MGKLNNPALVTLGPTGPIVSESTPSGSTFEGGAGFARDVHSELFLLAVTNFVGEDTFYERATDRDRRYVELVRESALRDPAWTAELLRWLRHHAHMRTASVVGAIEAAQAISMAKLVDAHDKGEGVPWSPRRIIDSVLLRADEPGEALAFWLHHYRGKLGGPGRTGRSVPMWLARGLGDAALRLYSEYSVAKWDSARNPVRFADVVELSQLKRAEGEERAALFRYLLDERHGHGDLPREGLPLLSDRAALMALSVPERRALLLIEGTDTLLTKAGMTWEAISGWLQGAMDADVWQRCIPLMGYGALIKNLANFDEAGISDETRQKVVARLTDPQAVGHSRLLPMAFLTAYHNVPSDHWKLALDTAATHALANVPVLPGRTLVLIDTSSSMHFPFVAGRGRHRRGRVELLRTDVATLFGLALAESCAAADVVSFSNVGADPRMRFRMIPGENLLAAVARFRRTHFIGGGTATKAAIDGFYAGHDRIVVLTDEQAEFDGEQVFADIPAKTPSYTFNLAGYEHGHSPSAANRHTVGGLSDAGFAMIAALEQRRNGLWPWQADTT